MNKLKQLGVSLLLVVGIGVLAVTVAPIVANAVDPLNGACTVAGASGNPLCAASSSGTTVEPFLKVLINTLLYIIGVIAVIVIIVGGIRYTVSGGDATAVKNAKNMIVAAVIGLVIAVLAFAIINWVLGALVGGTAATPAPTTPVTPTTP